MTGKFPKDFWWGTASAAHQIEGGLVNTWTEWEKANASRLAAEAPAKFAGWLPSWKQTSKAAENPANYISAKAIDFRHRYPQDVALMKQLGVNAFRFTIEWSRVEPLQGKFDRTELAYYHDLTGLLKKAGIEPIVGLWHWTLPLWIGERGWEHHDTVVHFGRYAGKLVNEFKINVRYWLTLNEPEIYAHISYLKAEWPPQLRNPLAYLRVNQNLIAAHNTAYTAIKKINPPAQVGLATNNVDFESADRSPVNLTLKAAAAWWINQHFLNRTQSRLDFIGLNFYFHSLINNGFNKNKNVRVSDLGWELKPQSIYKVLLGLKKYNKPIYITENGLADEADRYRPWFIKETVRAMRQALADGVDLRGYLHWSLIDNFEWDKGFWPNFGLFAVDRKTMARKPRPSYYLYKNIIRKNGL